MKIKVSIETSAGGKKGIKFLLSNGGKQVQFKKLPTNHKLAILVYMIESDMEVPTGFKYGSSIKTYLNSCKANMEFFDSTYGYKKFIIADVPIKVIEKVLLPTIDDRLNSIEDYYKFYTGGKKLGSEYKELDWPCIISGFFPEEVFEDGWHRFSYYLSKKLQKIPCIDFVEPFL
jgi:hypothetical protein